MTESGLHRLELADRRPEPGAVIGRRYRLGGAIGVGGTSSILEALDLCTGGAVAVKVLDGGSPASEGAMRLAREGRLAGEVVHPHVCEILDDGTLDDGMPYVVMERLQGETLAERMARSATQLPALEAVEIVLQLLSALSAVHAIGVVHRDIKPSNVFLTRPPGYTPHVKLIDFGAAVRVGGVVPVDSDALGLTREGAVVGTPAYLAPEQARGDRALDARVDLYACGVVLYEAFAGKRPFRGQRRYELLFDIVSGRYVPLRHVRSDLPCSAYAVVQRALALRPEDRFANAHHMRGALEVVRDELLTWGCYDDEPTIVMPARTPR